MMTLGDIIREYRSKNELTMDSFAQRANVSKAYISMLEKNKNSNNGKPIIPSLPTLRKVAAAINISIDELLCLLDSDQPIVIPKDKSSNKSASYDSKSNDIADMIDQLKDRLLSEKNLTFNGTPITTDDINDIVTAMRVGAGVALSQKKK